MEKPEVMELHISENGGYYAETDKANNNAIRLRKSADSEGHSDKIKRVAVCNHLIYSRHSIASAILFLGLAKGISSAYPTAIAAKSSPSTFNQLHNSLYAK